MPPSEKTSERGAAGELIKFGKSGAFLDIEYTDGKRKNNLEINIFKDKGRQVRKNNLKLDKLSDLVGQFRAVLFCPEHLSMIKDGPAARRSYLDIAISRTDPSYLASLQVYTHFLKHRNALIKNAPLDMKSFESTVEIYSERLAEEAAKIAKCRYKFLLKADEYVADCVSEMTGGKEKSKISYSGSARLKIEDYEDCDKVKESFFRLLMSSHAREIAAGATLWGIHKDDIDISLSGVPARIYGSQGQQRSLAIALKIAEGEMTKEACGDYPVFLFDDVLSELDAQRKDYLLKKMDKKQVIITTCEINSVKDLPDAMLIGVKGGKYACFKK